MNFKKHKRYSISDFIQDEDFIRWVKKPKKEDEVYWNTFLLSHSSKRQEIEEAKAIVEVIIKTPAHHKLSAEEKAEMLSNMRQQVFKKQNLKAPRISRRFWVLVAAAIILLFGVGTWTWVFPNKIAKKITVATTYSQQQSVKLPDGSLVKLNANSSLVFAEKWNDQDDRKVWLTGEAFFEVEKKAETNQKFQVITKDLTIEVLGTVFNVNSHQEATKVFLEEGMIKLNLNGLKQTMLMEPGELAVYSKNEKKQPEKRKVLPTVHTSWKDGLQLFENTPLSAVVEKLEEIYGVTIQVKNKSNYEREISTGLPIENLNEALSILEATLKLKIQKKEKGYIIQ